MRGNLSTDPTAGQVLLGQTGGGYEPRTMSGDVTIDENGNTTVAGSGGFSTQTSYNDSERVIGTIYQNTGSKAILVSACIQLETNSGVQALSDSNASPDTLVADFSNATAVNLDVNLTFLVLPGNYYEVAATTGTINFINWVEWS